MRSIPLALLLLGMIGCRGPLATPAFRRLDPDEQAQVDRIWNNILVKPDRLDRDLLLDVIIAFQLHASGVDRANFHSEKNYAQGSVIMDVRFDRSKPLEDWFFLEVHDSKGNVLRKEHYAGDEVWSHADELTGFALAATSQPVTRSFVTPMPATETITTTQPTIEPAATTEPSTMPTEAQLRGARLQIRYEQIIAATQPMMQ